MNVFSRFFQTLADGLRAPATGTASQSFSPATDSDDDNHWMTVNPASGLPMLNFGGIDVAGNPFGVDLSSDTSHSMFDDFGGASDSMSHDMFGDCGMSGDDMFD